MVLLGVASVKVIVPQI